MRINFEPIRVTARRRIVDENGKKKYQQRTFEQTVNPFNKNSDGTIKTREEVYESVNAEAKLWAEEHSNAA